MGSLANPERQSGAVNINALPRIDLGLAIQRQVIGIFGDDYARHRRLGRHATFDQPQLFWCLDNARLT